MLLRGTFVHAQQLGELEILHDHLVGVDENGFIQHIAAANSPQSEQFMAMNCQDTIINIPTGSFVLPTFCDLHMHAPQFLYQGTGLDLPLMKWLDTYALKAEARLDEDPKLAERVYTRLATRLKENGTGSALLFGTIKEETNLILANCMQAAGLRAFVGKLSMDIDITSPNSRTKTYIEKSTSESLAASCSFVQRCREIGANLPESQRLVEPVLTPRFVPTCTDELLAGLGAISETGKIKIQSHLAEAKGQVEWVRAERGIDDIDVFEKANLLTSRTVQAHCTFLNGQELDRLSTQGTSVAHCPLSNAYFSAKPFPLREALDQGVMVGLGTDVAGGYSLDIMSSMRQAVTVSRMREGDRNMKSEAAATGTRNLSIDWKEALFLATRGGSLALGLQGMFGVGFPFDAQEIHIYDSTGVGVGCLDYFELEGDTDSELHAELSINPEAIEKWWCIGDVRNRGTMWVQGKEVRSP